MSTHRCTRGSMTARAAGDGGSRPPSNAQCERSSGPAEKQRRKELTTDDIPQIVKAVLDTLPCAESSNSSSTGFTSPPDPLPTDNPRPTDNPQLTEPGLLQTPCHHPDISYLHRMAQQYYNNGLAPTTRSTYATGQQRYTAFCRSINVLPTPATE